MHKALLSLFLFPKTALSSGTYHNLGDFDTPALKIWISKSGTKNYSIAFKQGLEHQYASFFKKSPKFALKRFNLGIETFRT